MWVSIACGDYGGIESRWLLMVASVDDAVVVRSLCGDCLALKSARLVEVSDDYGADGAEVDGMVAVPMAQYCERM
jgi:hypothetical protein